MQSRKSSIKVSSDVGSKIERGLPSFVITKMPSESRWAFRSQNRRIGVLPGVTHIPKTGKFGTNFPLLQRRK
jgi:hypothetical protein